MFIKRSSNFIQENETVRNLYISIIICSFQFVSSFNKSFVFFFFQEMSPTHETTPNQIATNKLTITNRTETVESTQDSFLEIKNYIKILIEENKTTRSEMQQLRMELQQIHNQIEQLQVQLNV